MAMRRATEDELARWDELIVANPDGGNALQTWTWGEFKGRWGWQPRRYVYELKDERQIAAQWLVRRVPGMGEVWYCPKGPGVTGTDDYAEVVRQTKAARLKGVLARFESEVLADDVGTDRGGRTVPGGGSNPMSELVRANRDPGSKATVFVDLSGGEEATLASFNQSARRYIRKAEAAGVTVEAVEPGEANLSMMFDLMEAIEARAHYGLRPRGYFMDYWAAQTAAGQAQVFLAKHEGEVLSGIFVTTVGKRAWYKDGGSFDRKRDLAAPYLLQWEVMRWLMARGVTSYDLMGVPNRDRVGKGDPRDSLYEFKRKFNPEITEFVGCWDLPIGGMGRYRLWRRVGERVAVKLANMSPERFLY